MQGPKVQTSAQKP